MRLLMVSAASLFLSFSACGQGAISAPPITQRAVVVFAPGGRPSPSNQAAEYHVFVGDKGYHVVGTGPKAAGIYDVEVLHSDDNGTPVQILVHSYHPGGTVHGKQLDEQFRLAVISPYDDAPPQTGYAGSVNTDGRRLLIFYVSGAQNLFNAVAVDNATGKETRFRAVPRAGSDGGLGLGIYDFLFVPNRKPTGSDLGTLNVYQIKRDGTVVTHPLQVTEISTQ